MRLPFFIILTFCFTNVSFGQTDSWALQTNSTDIQIEAQFPGGISGWKKYLQENLNTELAKYIPRKKREKTVKQTVAVSFSVDKEGKVSDVYVLNRSDVHPILAKEAIRVFEEGPNWLPATHNGKPVIYRQRQNITWFYTAD